MYNDYKDVAEFRLIYIREAHAIDGASPMRGRNALDIKEHKTFEERCQTAQQFIDDKSLTLPMLIDNMDNSTDAAYSAKPDRIFLVRADGRLGVAAGRGPWGFKPGLTECESWLKEFKKSGKEKEISAADIAIADKKTASRKPATPAPAAGTSTPKPAAGTAKEDNKK